MNEENYQTYIPQNIPTNQPRIYGDQLDFIKELLSKKELKQFISDDLQIYFESFVKNMAIANLSEKEINLMILRFDDLKTAYLMQYPPGAYSNKIEMQFTAMRAVLTAELSRAKNGFERQLMATSIQQSYMQSDFRSSPTSPQTGGGFMGKLRKMFNRY